MCATHRTIAFNRRIASVEVLNGDLAIAVGLHAGTSHIYLNAGGASSISRQKLLDRVVNSVEAYSDQLADLAAALSRLTDTDE